MGALLEEPVREEKRDISLTGVLRRAKGRTPRSYTNEEIGTALAVLEHYDGNALRTARELGLPRQTIVDWSRKVDSLPAAVVKIRERKREEFARLSDEAAEWIITSITPKDIREASLYQKATSYGIFRDKSLLDRGEATQIVEHKVTVAIQATFRKLVEMGRPEDEAKRIVASRFRLQPTQVDEIRAELKQ